MLFLLPILIAAAQVTPDPPLLKGTGLPPTAAEAEGEAPAVLAAVQRLLDGIAARDPAAVLAQVRPEGAATASLEQPGGPALLRHQSWAAFAAGIRSGPERYAERLTDPAVEVDGDIAMVWSPYVSTVDGAVRHCGTEHVDLVREHGEWRVLDLTWTQRTTGCEAP